MYLSRIKWTGLVNSRILLPFRKNASTYSYHARSRFYMTNREANPHSPFLGSLSLGFNKFKYHGRMVLPAAALVHPNSYSELLSVIPDLEQYEKSGAEMLLLSGKKSLWTRVKMLARMIHLLIISYLILIIIYFFYSMQAFLPAIATSPLFLVFEPQSKWIQWWWALLRKTLEHGGACFIKLGQWASTRPDLFPSELCQQLVQLHSSCPSHSGGYSIKLICKELKCKLDDLFFYFDPVPMASGSIAQVHKGVLLNGRVVVVKVLHPHVFRSISIDFRILYSIVNILNKIPNFKWLSLPEAALEFGKSMILQLDLRREAGNLIRFQENFRKYDSIAFPTPVYSRRSVLIETFEPGESISEIIKNKRWDNSKIASIGFNAYLKMMLIDNFTHSDLHPGNILVRQSKKSQEPQLVMLDVGLVTELSARDRSNFMELFEAVVTGNGRLGADLMVKYATESQCTGEQKEQFKEEMGKIFDEVQNKPLQSVRVGQLLNQVLTAVRSHLVKIESNFATLVMGTIVLEGLGKQLDPNLNLLKQAIPYFAKEEKMYFLQRFFDKIFKRN